MGRGTGKSRIPPQVLEEARRKALASADDEPQARTPEKQRRIKEKVVAALKKLHPMD
jgi:hypothetical protein